MHITGTMKSAKQRGNTTISSTTDLKLLFGNHNYPTAPSSFRLLTWIIFTSCVIGLGDMTSPLNLAAARDSKVQLNCSTENTKTDRAWSLVNISGVSRVFYTGDYIIFDFQRLFTLDDSIPGHFNLRFSMSEKTSGTYRCTRGDTSDAEVAEVIMLDSQPTCSKDLIPGFVKASCSIGYSGFWSPKLEWRGISGRLEPSNTILVGSSKVTSSLMVPFEESDPRASYHVTCAPVFKTENKPNETTATNIPVFPRSCTVTSDEGQSMQSISSLPPSSPPLFVIGITCVFAYVLPL